MCNMFFVIQPLRKILLGSKRQALLTLSIYIFQVIILVGEQFAAVYYFC